MSQHNAASAHCNTGCQGLKLEQLSKLMGFVRTITIIGGALLTIGGVFVFAIGALLVIITSILGVTLRKAKNMPTSCYTKVRLTDTPRIIASLLAA